MARLKEQYATEIVPAMKKKFGYSNVLSVPRLKKVVVNMGVGSALENKARLDYAMNDLARITGQKPMMRKATKSIAGFKVREGNPIGCKVTLRRERMYEFLDRLINVAIPRFRDFRGVSDNAFDGTGNYSMGVAEQSVFPEVDVDRMEFVQGMDITMVTTAKTDEECRELLTLFGMPFARRD